MQQQPGHLLPDAGEGATRCGLRLLPSVGAEKQSEAVRGFKKGGGADRTVTSNCFLSLLMLGHGGGGLAGAVTLIVAEGPSDD